MRRSFFGAVMLAGLAAVVATTASEAQSDYPNRVVKIVNPFGAGSAPDILARATRRHPVDAHGPAVHRREQGRRQRRGRHRLGRARRPDGYTLLFAPALVLSVLPQARTDTGYKPDSLIPVCQTLVNSMALAVRPDSPIKSVADLIATAKQKPGQLNYGHPGPLTLPHLAVEELQQVASADIKDIPFRSGPQSLTELLGGRLDFVSLVIGIGNRPECPHDRHLHRDAAHGVSGPPDRQGAGLRRHHHELRRIVRAAGHARAGSREADAGL